MYSIDFREEGGEKKRGITVRENHQLVLPVCALTWANSQLRYVTRNRTCNGTLCVNQLSYLARARFFF